MNEKMKSYTHVALVLDASGSMSHLRDGTVATPPAANGGAAHNPGGTRSVASAAASEMPPCHCTSVGRISDAPAGGFPAQVKGRACHFLSADGRFVTEYGILLSS